MKKRVLLTIMILFSIKVNSGDGMECKLPDITFFEMVDDNGVQKFNFESFVDRGELKPETDDIEYFGVKFDKALALGALIHIKDLFVHKIDAVAKKASLELKDVVYGEIDTDISNKAWSTYQEQLDPKIDLLIQQKIAGRVDASGILVQKGIVDSLIDIGTPSTWYSWIFSGTPCVQAVHSAVLNKSLTYVYLFALKFLIKDPKDLSKFLTCMEVAREDIELSLEAQSIPGRVQLQNIFNTIQIESNMKEDVKPEPLTLEQSRAALNMLSSTLNSLAHLKFT